MSKLHFLSKFAMTILSFCFTPGLHHHDEARGPWAAAGGDREALQRLLLHLRVHPQVLSSFNSRRLSVPEKSFAWKFQGRSYFRTHGRLSQVSQSHRKLQQPGNFWSIWILVSKCETFHLNYQIEIWKIVLPIWRH